MVTKFCCFCRHRHEHHHRHEKRAQKSQSQNFLCVVVSEFLLPHFLSCFFLLHSLLLLILLFTSGLLLFLRGSDAGTRYSCEINSPIRNFQNDFLSNRSFFFASFVIVVLVTFFSFVFLRHGEYYSHAHVCTFHFQF